MVGHFYGASKEAGDQLPLTYVMDFTEGSN